MNKKGPLPIAFDVNRMWKVPENPEMKVLLIRLLILLTSSFFFFFLPFAIFLSRVDCRPANGTFAASKGLFHLIRTACKTRVAERTCGTKLVTVTLLETSVLIRSNTLRVCVCMYRVGSRTGPDGICS